MISGGIEVNMLNLLNVRKNNSKLSHTPSPNCFGTRSSQFEKLSTYEKENGRNVVRVTEIKINSRKKCW